MRILPVMDVLRGVVVRGVAGRREEYRPIESRLAGSAQPAAIGGALAERGARDCYVADLDAIAGEEPGWTIYRELIDCGLRLWVDAGCGDAAAAAALATFAHEGHGLHRIVVGLESLRTAADWRAIQETLGADRLVFSLDLQRGAPMAQPGMWSGMSAEEIAGAVLEAGVASMIVLDLAAVGGYAGPASLPLCAWIRAAWPHVELISGGGVRDQHDLARFAAAGCDRVLVASALHDGRIACRFT